MDTDASTESDTPGRWWARDVRPRSTLVVFVVFLALVAACGRAADASPYLRSSPGSATPIVFHGEKVGTDGTWQFTTVSVEPVDWVSYWWLRANGRDDELQRRPTADTSASNRTLSAAAMDTSERTAWAVALERIGTPVDVASAGALIVGVLEGSPAQRAGVVPGDVIVGVGDAEIRDAGDLGGLIEGRTELTVRRSDGTVEDLIVDAEDVDGAWKIGVHVEDDIDLPDPEFKIATRGAGGPSAGLMFTLAYLDALIEGDPAGGRTVAGTGTIDLDGTVGPVGGAQWKVAAALDAGADVFLVPTENAEEAQGAAGGRLEIVPVTTIDEAVAWLCGSGGAPGDLCGL